MLAYVFWHRNRPEVDSADYEKILDAFHAALAAEPPAGFRGSAVHAVSGVPWLPGRCYEDWYLVDDWAALGTLNEAAVDARRYVAHAPAARAVESGVAGIYRLQAGAPAVDRAGLALWLHKPRDVRYAAWREHLAAYAGGGAAVWERQMVLGPSPEYCVVAGVGAAAAPEPAAAIERRPVVALRPLDR